MWTFCFQLQHVKSSEMVIPVLTTRKKLNRLKIKELSLKLESLKIRVTGQPPPQISGDGQIQRGPCLKRRWLEAVARRNK